MIKETPAFFGMNGFFPFLGKVVSRDDPQQLGRTQIRIFGVHSENTTDIPDDSLPWAYPFMPVTSAGLKEVGQSPTGIMEGSIVFGFFLDGDDCQQPVILGTFAGAPGGVNDVAQLARGTNTVDKKITTGIEPPSPYNAKYPFNKVFVTEGGHVIEIDDTPQKERIHVYHRTGSYHEIDADGNYVKKTVGNDYDVAVKDKTLFVQGNYTIYVKGNINIEAHNDVNLAVGGSLNASVAESIKMKASSIIMEADAISFKGGSISASPNPNNITWSSIAQSTGLPAPSSRDVSVYVPTVEDRQAFEDDDNGDDREPSVASTPTEERSTDTANATPATTTICGITIKEGENNDDVRLSTNYTVGQLSSYAAVSHYRVVAQGGLTEQEIICNLKLLAENALEKIKAQYPTAFITSGFRSPAAASQHTKGQAADIQFFDLNALGPGNAQRSGYYDRCVWISQNVSFDQLIMEYKTTGTGQPWIHCSFNKDNLRRSMLTYNNQAKYANGIKELFL